MNTSPAISLALTMGLCLHAAIAAPEAPVSPKKHPGHQMEVSFAPKQDGFLVGQPVEVVLTIKNIGKSAFTFMRGGRQRGARDNQFAFSAGTANKMLPDIGNPMNFGGIGTFVTLEPGEEVKIPVDLKKWFAFDEPGFFSVRGSYAMDFYDPKSESPASIWTDFACAEFALWIQGGPE